MTQLVTMLALASLATLGWLTSKRTSRHPLLPFEPRRPVPWNFVIVALALAPALVSIAGAAAGAQPPQTAEAEPTPSLTVEALWQFAALYSLMAAMCYVVLAAVFGADGSDLGLPQSGADLATDIRTGAIAWLAALFPVYAIQLLLVMLIEGTEQHPIIVELEADRSAAMMIAAGLGAVVAAPLFEETAFRLVFQGWLEKHESPPRLAPGESLEEPVAALFEPPTQAATAFERVESPDQPDAAGADFSSYAAPSADAEPPPGDAILRFAVYDPNRPCNWAPILMSSALFALAHVGQGVAPFSLFPLALVLGYLYQRTHRIVPSIVCHALFNATTLLAVWASATEDITATLPAN